MLARPVTVSVGAATAGEIMAFVVDTIELEPRYLEPYLEAVEQLGLPVMTDAGATLVSCARTSTEFEPTVTVQTVWSFDDHVHWNIIRKNLVLDPRWYEYSERLARLRGGGTRRFYYPVAFSPS
jgi:NIPSNAP protein